VFNPLVFEVAVYLGTAAVAPGTVGSSPSGSDGKDEFGTGGFNAIDFKGLQFQQSFERIFPGGKPPLLIDVYRLFYWVKSS